MTIYQPDYKFAFKPNRCSICKRKFIFERYKYVHKGLGLYATVCRKCCIKLYKGEKTK